MRRHPFFLIVALLCLAAADGGAATPPLAVELTAEQDAPRLDPLKVAAASISAPPAAAERKIRGNPLWGIPLRQLNATRERPLFAASRRAPAPVVASAPPPPPPPPQAEKPPEAEVLQLSLIGTVAGGTGALGVFLDKAGGTPTPLRLKVGERHKGWTLRTVGRREAVLAKGMATTVLAMVEPEASKPKSPAPANALAPKPQASMPSQPPTEARMTDLQSKEGTANVVQFDPLALAMFKHLAQ